MSLLNGTREGLRIDATVVRERLLAAQYRNGYRALGVRLIEEYSQVAQLQMSRGNRLDKMRPQIDRQVVEGIIVPLAFFIRDRAEPEPLEALQSRAELFRDIVDKMVTSGDPFSRTAEALKPLLRRSIEQTRPLVLEAFSYLAAPIESLKPTEVHRATALLHMFETLLRPDLDEKALQAVEPKEFAVLAKSVTQQFRPTGIGAYDRQQSIGAHPVPVDLPTGLAAIGYHPHKENRFELFRKEVRELIETGTAPDLRKALDYLRRFRRAVEEQRVKRGLVDTETSPYVGEIWLKEFEFREEEEVEAIRVAALANKMDWEGVTECRVNPIRGTLGCRALLKLRDGASKVVLCEFDRRYQRWKVIHFAPLVMDVVREELVRLGRILPQKFRREVRAGDVQSRRTGLPFHVEERRCRPC